MRIGFIGLGIMGSRMAANLQKAGHELIVYNRTPDKAQELVADGALLTTTPADVGQKVDTVITMLAHPEAVSEAALGENGFLKTLPEKALWIDCSTVNPTFSRSMAAEAKMRNIRFVDAPVGGSKNQAEEAELIFIVGGDVADVETCEPLFDTMGSRTVHVGANGMGTSMKNVVNLMLATSMAAFAEGMALGEALGISQETLLNVLVGGPVVAPFVAGKREKLASGDYDAEFPLRWMQKDLQMASIAAYDATVSLPMSNVAKELFQLAVQEGRGDDDFSGIYQYYKDKQSQ